MRFSKLAWTSVILLTSLSLARTQPAEPTPVAPPHAPVLRPASKTPLHSLLAFIGNESLQTELKLSPEQVKKLLALRQKVWDTTYTTVPVTSTAKQDERDAATTAAMKEFLTPEQITRAGQLARQHAWRPRVAVQDLDFTHVRSEVLRSEPELAAALKLTANQQKLVAEEKKLGSRSVPVAHEILLTAEQTEIAKKLLGPLTKTDWKGTRDPRMDAVQVQGYSDVYTPRRLATLPIFQAEAKPTDEQIQRIGKGRGLIGSRRWNPDISPEEALKQAQETDAVDEQELAKILTVEQMTRLRQIALRELRDPAMRNTIEPLIIGLADELQITPAQKQKNEALRATHAKAVAKAALTDDQAEARAGIRSANAEFQKALSDALTDAQRAKLKMLVGEPIAVKTNELGLPLTDSTRKQREETFGRYTNELSLLSLNKSIQTELKLTPDQLDFTKKTVQEMTKRFGLATTKKMPDVTPAEQAAAKSKFIGESLPAILDAQQAKRFRQIMIQHREYPQSRFSLVVHSGLAYPGVVEELKLTVEQKQQVIDGEAPIDVLTPAQRKAFKEMLGERFTGDFTTTTRTTVRPATPPSDFADRARAAFLVSGPPLHSLGLTPEQQTQLATAVTQFQLDVPDFKVTFKAPTTTLAPKDTAGPAVRALQIQLRIAALDGDFLKRLDQLFYQSCAANNLGDTFRHWDVSIELKLTPLQALLFTEIEDEMVGIAQLVSRSELTSGAREDILKQLRDRLDARLLATLTPEQSAKWKAMLGDPYDGFVKATIRTTIPLSTR